MNYRLHITTKRGLQTVVGTPCDLLERAIDGAWGALRHGAIDAWVLDEEGNRCADLETIKRRYKHD